MHNLIDNPPAAVLAVVLIVLLLLVSAVVSLIRTDRNEQLYARDTRRRQSAEQALAEEKKAHAETTNALERQRLICANCPNRNPGGAS